MRIVNMLKLSKKIANNGKCVRFLSNITCSGENKEAGRAHVRKFEEIPGPKSYPIIGTLYKYAPYIGKRFCYFYHSVRLDFYLTISAVLRGFYIF